MRKSLVILTLTILLFACNEPKKRVVVDDKEKSKVIKIDSLEFNDMASTTSETDTLGNGMANVKEETEEDITAIDSINFDKYAVDVEEVVKKAPLDFSSYPDAKFFRTRIIDAYKSNTIDFGGHYVGVIFGCGASCIMGFMVDVRDGKIYDLPLGEQNMCFWDLDKAICNSYSRLFISAICKENEDSKTANYIAYVWNEENKLFEHVSSEEFIIKK